MSAVAARLEALDADWFTQVLSDGGHATAAVITPSVPSEPTSSDFRL